MTTLFDLDRVFLFTLLVARATGIVVASPFLGDRIVPTRVKVLLVPVLALFMITFAPTGAARTESLAHFVGAVAAELSIGFALGFVARLVLVAFEMAGHVIAIQIGFGLAQVFDPVQGHAQNLLSRWYWIIGMTCFLGFGGHHHLLRALAGTLEWIPPGAGFLSPEIVDTMARLSAQSLATMMAIAAPVIGVLLLTSMGLGILARTVPQMNVFIVGFPIKIAAGILGIVLSLPFVMEVARREMNALALRLSFLLNQA